MKKIRRFTFSEGTSNKFWQITLADASLTTTFGKIGTDGQSSTKDFADAATALKEHDKLIAEKTRKGYVEDGAVTAAPPGAAEKPVAEMPGAAEKLDFKKHFAYLIDDPAAQPVFDAIAAAVQDITQTAAGITVRFSDQHTLTATPPEKKALGKRWPAAFAAMAARHATLSFPDTSGWALVLAACEGVDDLDELPEDSELGDPAKLLSPLQDFSDLWIFHPQDRTFCLLSHESAETQAPTGWPVGATFLDRVANILGLTVRLSETRPDLSISAAAGVPRLLWSQRFTDLPDKTRVDVVSFSPDGRYCVVGTLETLYWHEITATGPRFITTITTNIVDQKDGLHRRLHAWFTWLTDRLIVADEIGFLVIDISARDQPRVTASVRDDWAREGGWSDGIFVYFCRYNHNFVYSLHHPNESLTTTLLAPVGKGVFNDTPGLSTLTDGLWRQRLDGSAPERVSNPFYSGKDVLGVGDQLFVMSQDTLHRFSRTGDQLPVFNAHINLNLNRPKLAFFPADHRVAVIETFSDLMTGISVIDVAGKKMARTDKLLAKTPLSGFDVDADSVYGVTKKKNQWFLYRVRICGTPAVVAGPLLLSGTDDDREDFHTVRVTGDQERELLIAGDCGTIIRYAL